MYFIFLDFGYWIALAAIYYYFSLSCVSISNICLGVKSLYSQTDSWTDTQQEGTVPQSWEIKGTNNVLLMLYDCKMKFYHHCMKWKYIKIIFKNLKVVTCKTPVLHTLNGNDVLPVTSWQEHRFMIFEPRVLRWICLWERK